MDTEKTNLPLSLRTIHSIPPKRHPHRKPLSRVLYFSFQRFLLFFSPSFFTLSAYPVFLTCFFHVKFLLHLCLRGILLFSQLESVSLSGYSSLLNHLPIDGHLGCFQSLVEQAIMQWLTLNLYNIICWRVSCGPSELPSLSDDAADGHIVGLAPCRLVSSREIIGWRGQSSIYLVRMGLSWAGLPHSWVF